MAIAEMTLEAALRAIRLERHAAEAELGAVDRRRRELREAIRDCDRRRDELLDDLVVERPLLDFAQGRAGGAGEVAPATPSIPESTPSIPESTPSIPESTPSIPKATPEPPPARDRLSRLLGIWGGDWKRIGLAALPETPGDVADNGRAASWAERVGEAIGFPADQPEEPTAGDLVAWLTAGEGRSVGKLAGLSWSDRDLVEVVLTRLAGTCPEAAIPLALLDNSPEPEPPAVEEREAPAYTWHAYPISNVVPGHRPTLARRLEAEGLDTLGAWASWLSDGNEVDELEFADGGLIDRDDAGAIRAALLAKLDELAVPADEFPRSWVDPDLLARALWRVEFKPKARNHPPTFLRAFTEMQAAVEATRRWPDSRVVVPHEGELPPGARVFDAPRDTPEERAEQFAAEERARRADEERRKAEREARESEERARAAGEAASKAPPSLFSVRPRRQKTPVYFVRAAGLREACEHVRAQHPKDAKMVVSLWEGEPPGDAVVHTAGRVAEAG